MLPARNIVMLFCLLQLFTHFSQAASEANYQAQSVKIDDLNKIWIFDNILGYDELQALFECLGFISESQFMHRNVENAIENGVTAFHAIVNKSEIPRLTSTVKSLVENAVGQQTYLIEVYGEFLHSLDPKPPVKDGCSKDTYQATMFLNEIWRHNSYGQISFYSDTGSSGRLEIVHTVHPKPGRIVVWPSCVTHASHPPSVNYFTNLRMLTMKFSTDIQNSDQVSIVTDKPSSFGNFKFTNEDANRTINYKKHLKRSFSDSKKRGVYVFDDLFTTAELRQFREHILDYGHPFVSQYDGGPLEDNDNVQWIAGYNTSEFVKTQMWDRVKGLLFYLTKEDQWYPYDVALNYIRPADHTRIHPDAESHQFEYTYLLYLTENLTQSDFGETVFFEQESRKSDGIHQYTNPGGEEFEPIGAVWPKYGRVAIFRNIIQHSARPLTNAHLGCRFTFATKVARSERLAYIKKLYESMEAVGELDQKQQKLNRELSTGFHDDERRSRLSLEDLKNRVKETKIGAKDFLETHREMFIKMMK